MNLLIGLVILLCLVCSEIQTAEVASDLWARLLLVGIVSLSVPGLALFQTLIVSHRFQHTNLSDTERESILRRLSACHSAVWLSASLAIIWAVRWQDVVRGNWNLDHWPLLDEILIIAPVILSLVGSWAIFYEIQQSIQPQRKRFDLEDLKSRIGFVSIRFRVYCLIVLIPISIAVLARDLAPRINSLPWATQAALSSFCLLLVIAGFPFLLLLIWRNERIQDDGLRRDLLNVCEQNRLFIHDVRKWNTGQQIINALVAGLLPRFRVMLLSDSLIHRFAKNELLAVVRHEAGHLKLFHLPIRIGFIVLPLVGLAIDEQSSIGLGSTLESSLNQIGCPAGSAVGLICVAFVGYLFMVLPWLSHQMEFEADIYACQERPTNRQQAGINPIYANDMADALLRLAAYSPTQYARATLLHPSIEHRIQMIRAVEQSPDHAHEFCRSFARRRRIALGGLIMICLVTLLY